MNNHRKLGIYWGNTGISLVELNKDTAVNSAFVSFDDIDRNAPIVGTTLSSDLRLLDLIQKVLRSGSFSANNSFLSLPSKDIIVRWFVIPWVKAEEIQGMVTFEAKKYVPFPLEELFFNYYPSTISKDGIRQIGIALTAIRKAHYEHYYNILIQAGVNVVYSEPSAMSLLRTLVFRKFVDTDKTSAILVAREDSCEIAIVSKGYMRFIRDFSIRSAQPSAEPDDDDFFRMKLFNEVRMSIDFFSRNNAGPDVEKIFAVSSGMKASYFDGMAEDIGIAVQVLNHSQVLEQPDALVDIGYIRAFGVGLSGEVPAVVDFNLSEGNIHGAEKKIVHSRPLAIPPQFFLLAGVICGCISLIAAGWWWTGDQIAKKRALKQEVSSRLGRYLDVPKEEIDANLLLANKKIQAIKSLPLKSSLTAFFVNFVKLIPDGIWLDSIDLSYDTSGQGTAEAAPSIRPKKLTASDYFVVKSSGKLLVTGFASLGDTNAEFQLVNRFVDQVSNDPQVKQIFTDVKLKVLQARDTGDKQKLTAFTIEFK